MFAEKALRRKLPPAPGHEVFLAGSCAPATLFQLEHFEQRHPLFRVDLVKAAESDTMVDEIEEWAKPLIGKEPIAMSTSETVEGLKRVQSALGRNEAAALAMQQAANIPKPQ